MQEYVVFKEDEKPFAGVIIAINDDGSVAVHEGLVKNSDHPSLVSHRNPTVQDSTDEPTTTVDEVPYYTQAMKGDIACYRKSIAKVAIAKDSNLGSDLLQFDLCYTALHSRWCDHALDIQSKDTFEESSKKDILESKSQKELEETLGKLDRTWISEDKLESFKGFRKLTAKSKKELTAYVAACSLSSYEINDKEVAFTDYLCSEAKISKSDYFRPQASNYFKRISEPHFTKIATEIMGESWMEENKTKKKSVIATYLENAMEGNQEGSDNTEEFLKAWIPKGI